MENKNKTAACDKKKKKARRKSASFEMNNTLGTCFVGGASSYSNSSVVFPIIYCLTF